MTITNPSHWIEQGQFKGDKYDKILEIIAELNTPTSIPADHASEHQDGGGDEISVANLSGLLADAQTPLGHKASHQDGGGDEISVEGLSGDLADVQDPKDHASTHTSAGGDPLTDVVFLAGDQTINGVKTYGSIPVLPAPDPTTDNQAARKGYVDYFLHANPSSPYTTDYPAPLHSLFDYLDSANLRNSVLGVYIAATGTVYMYFQVHPPMWLYRYAEWAGKTLKATDVRIRWQNQISADYITRVIIYYVDGHTYTYTALLDDTTDKGSGSTGFRDDAYNITNSVGLIDGDAIHFRVDCQQGTANSCRIRSLQVTWSIT